MNRTALAPVLLLAAAVTAWFFLPLGKGPSGDSSDAQVAAAVDDEAGDASEDGAPAAATEPAVPPLRPVPAATRVAATPPGIAALVGRVLDALGQPLAECAVTFVEHDQEIALDRRGGAATAARAEATSGSDGRFRLVLGAHQAGVVALRHRDFPLRVAVGRVHVEPGETHDLGDVTLFSQPGLVVTVRTPAGSAVANAIVTARPAMQDLSLPAAVKGLAERVAMTDATGQATLYGLDPGPHHVHVEATHCATRIVSHQQPDSPTRTPELTVILEAGMVIRGRVEARGGGDPGPTRVSAVPTDGGPPLETKLRSGGEFRLTGARTGRYRVAVDSLRFGWTQVEVDVPGGPITVTLEAGHSLRGVVRARDDGALVAGALITAEPEDGWPLVRAGETFRPTAVSNPAGVFCVVGLPAGRFTLRVTSQLFVPTRLGPFATDSSPVEIVLDRGLRVRGRLRGHRGSLPGARVQAIDWAEEEGATFALWKAALASERLRETLADQNGEFELGGLDVRGQRLVVEVPEHAIWFSPILAGREGECLDLGTLVLAREAVIEGQTEPHATVRLDSPTASGLTRSTHADHAGRFAFRGLPAGDYELSYHSAKQGRPAARSAAGSAPKTSLTLRPGHRVQVALTH